MKPMRGPHQNEALSSAATVVTPAVKNLRAQGIAKSGPVDASVLTGEFSAEQPVVTSASGPPLAGEAKERAERRRRLPIIIRKRIESRLRGRIRKLSVRISDDVVVLEGECATYYTKQLAQHAAIAVLEDEQLKNAIVVTVHQ